MNHLTLQKGYFSLEKNRKFFIIKRFMEKASSEVLAKGASELSKKSAKAAATGVPHHVSSNPSSSTKEASKLTTGTTQSSSNKPTRPILDKNATQGTSLKFDSNRITEYSKQNLLYQNQQHSETKVETPIPIPPLPIKPNSPYLDYLAKLELSKAASTSSKNPTDIQTSPHYHNGVIAQKGASYFNQGTSLTSQDKIVYRQADGSYASETTKKIASKQLDQSGNNPKKAEPQFQRRSEERELHSIEKIYSDQERQTLFDPNVLIASDCLVCAEALNPTRNFNVGTATFLVIGEVEKESRALKHYNKLLAEHTEATKKANEAQAKTRLSRESFEDDIKTKTSSTGSLLDTSAGNNKKIEEE